MFDNEWKHPRRWVPAAFIGSLPAKAACLARAAAFLRRSQAPTGPEIVLAFLPSLLWAAAAVRTGRNCFELRRADGPGPQR